MQGFYQQQMQPHPSPLIEPPPLHSIVYSTEKTAYQWDMVKRNGFLQDMAQSPSARLVGSDVFKQQEFNSGLPSNYGDFSFIPPSINIGLTNNIYPIPHNQQPMMAHPPQPTVQVATYLFNANQFDASSSLISKKTTSCYATLAVNKLLGAAQSTNIYRWDVKINDFKSWLALGVIQAQTADDGRFSYSPYDEHGSYLLSSNGYIWNRQMEGTNKYEYITGSNYNVGDVITLELNCAKKELSYFKNSFKVASIGGIKLPVYPSFTMHGNEAVEFKGVTEIQQTTRDLDIQFSSQNYHVSVNGRVVTKKTSSVYNTVFLKNSLGDSNNFGIFRWKIKLVQVNSWIGVGCATKDIAQGCFYDLSPYDNHGGYIYSMNGYAWSPFFEGDKKYENIGASSSVGDVITLELNCSTKELVITKDGKNLTTFKKLVLPVHPFVMMHGTEIVEFVEFQQLASYASQDQLKFDTGFDEFKYDPSTIKVVGCKITKLTETGYSNIYINKECGTDTIIKRWKVKITKLANWIGLGVIMKEFANQKIFGGSPYDENGAYILSANGYIWDRFMDDPKYKLVEGAKFVGGDTIIVEINCITKELSFYKNSIATKLATIEHVKLPVYPFIMMYGNDQVEVLDYVDNVVINGTGLIDRVPTFRYLPSCITITGDKIQKTTSETYTRVFVNTPLGKLSQQDSVFRWNVRIVSLSWIGVGVIRRDVGDKGNFAVSPYDDHGSYFLSANGYVWNRQLADPYYQKVEGATFRHGDVLLCVLDCKNQKLQILKNNVVIATISDIRLPVYPSLVLYDTESVEFSWA